MIGHCDRLHGDTATAELFGVGRFMSCDSVRRNFASILDGKALPWVWRENLHLLQDVLAEDYVLDLDQTVKPLYGHQEGAEFGYNPQKPGRPSHNRTRVPRVRHDPADVPSRHRRPDDHAAHLKRPSAILTNVSASFN